MSDDDEHLVKAALAGQRQAFDELIGRYQRPAVAVALRLLNNLDDAMEVAQDAFLKAYQALAQLNEPKRFGPWLMRIVSNQALNYRRSRSRLPRISIDQVAATDSGNEKVNYAAQIADDEPTAYQQLTARELNVALRQAIDDLPDNLRVPLELFTVEKMPQKEIAEMMNCSLQTVKWSVFEARRRLKNQLKKML